MQKLILSHAVGGFLSFMHFVIPPLLAALVAEATTKPLLVIGTQTMNIDMAPSIRWPITTEPYPVIAIASLTSCSSWQIKSPFPPTFCRLAFRLGGRGWPSQHDWIC